MKSIYTLLTSLAIIGLTACTSAGVTSSGGADMDSARADAYDGPKARIAIADFEDKMSSSGYYRGEYGRGMSDMLGTALFQTNRYIVLEREKLKAVEAERKRRNSATKIEDADIMVTAAVTGFDPGTAGAKGNVGGAFGGLLGGVTGAFQQAHVAIDLRVIDVDTGRVIAATSVEGKASGFGGGVGGIGGKLGGGLSGFAKGPMETAIRKMIQAAVDEVVRKTPKTYYRYQR
jgi:curli biogenesis system outer membrane secretion channel CsgG